MNPGIPAVLSFVFTGLGQIYNGQIAKGIFLMFLTAIGVMGVIIGTVIIAYSVQPDVVVMKNVVRGCIIFVVSLIFMIAVGIYNLYDAYNTAKKQS